MSIEMATREPAFDQAEYWPVADSFIYDEEVRLATEDPARRIPESPPSTISFSEDSPSQPFPERLPPSDKVSEAEGASLPAIEISDVGEAKRTRTRPQKGPPPDYTCQKFRNDIDQASAESPNPRKRKKEGSDTVNIPSELVSGNFQILMSLVYTYNWKDQIAKRIRRELETLEQKNHQLHEDNHKLKQENKRCKQKKRGVLICAGCRSTKQNWKILGCRHLLCTQCVEDVKPQGAVFGYPCPQCNATIELCLDCFPTLLEV